jgi:hypothetical protein
MLKNPESPYWGELGEKQSVNLLGFLHALQKEESKTQPSLEKGLER